MKILVTLGKVFDAEKLVPVQHAHVTGTGFKTFGEVGVTACLLTLSSAQPKALNNASVASCNGNLIPLNISIDSLLLVRRRVRLKQLLPFLRTISGKSGRSNVSRINSIAFSTSFFCFISSQPTKMRQLSCLHGFLHPGQGVFTGTGGAGQGLLQLPGIRPPTACSRNPSGLWRLYAPMC